MAQEFTIKSQDIEDKINQLLPSQGGAGAGVDFSASTMVIPIVDLTETAEGSALRQDLQRSISFTTANAFEISNASTTLLNTTGYYNFRGLISAVATGANLNANFEISDGTTQKELFNFYVNSMATTTSLSAVPFNFDVKLTAGDSIIANSDNTAIIISGTFRQIADINGNLTNP